MASNILFLFRHGKAEAHDAGRPDFDRQLVEKGVVKTRAVAQKLSGLYKGSNMLISSPAVRALQTAQITADALSYPRENILIREEIYYGNSTNALLTVLRDQSEEFQNIILFGHDPGFSMCARSLIPGFDVGISKSAVIGIRIPVNWQIIKPNLGTLVLLLSPKLMTP